MWPNPKEIADLVTFTEEVLNGKFQFFIQHLLQDLAYNYGVLRDLVQFVQFKKREKHP